ncbi:pyridoxamine 5'-phosphate oxidase-related, FMN-binding [Caballeronia hypogeia]|uniref:Pyridoxamine 5'-phosphate oxidase-related, FMN-binding n=1 Tax=Caballeronia hypogeia TaxID=1777140 RepID=A0A158DHX4_9BURK|nr:pyridoxamine 5'-phosphate oxidase family protein [Caballeronia hypogeia]SAK93407.1 pyridoxamine 5'-phosphate oxidase-related, FMN-binding [Caballeronia hypogeia]
MSDRIVSPSSLEQVVRTAWSSLADAANPSAPRSRFTMLSLATIGIDGGPRMRTVVLRGVDETAGAVVFYTDARSTKLAEIARDNRVALLACDSGAGIQIRLEGRAIVSLNDSVTKAHWDTARERSLIVYRTPLAPGVAIDSPEQGYVAMNEAHAPFDGYEHFSVVTVSVQAIDWLDLSPRGHERAVFRRDADAWKGQWIAP